jgi:hypothetical protein
MASWRTPAAPPRHEPTASQDRIDDSIKRGVTTKLPHSIHSTLSVGLGRKEILAAVRRERSALEIAEVAQVLFHFRFLFFRHSGVADLLAD